MDNTGNIYQQHARIWRKERNDSEKTLAIKNTIKVAKKYFPHLIPLLRHELEYEQERLRYDNIRRNRMSIIGR
jgi:hypothetical protein